jgi:hypothetical protein
MQKQNTQTDSLFSAMANISKAHAYDIVNEQRIKLMEDKTRLEGQVKELREALQSICDYWEEKGEDENTLPLKDNILYQSAKTALNNSKSI